VCLFVYFPHQVFASKVFWQHNFAKTVLIKFEFLTYAGNRSREKEIAGYGAEKVDTGR